MSSNGYLQCGELIVVDGDGVDGDILAKGDYYADAKGDYYAVLYNGYWYGIPRTSALHRNLFKWDNNQLEDVWYMGLEGLMIEIATLAHEEPNFYYMQKDAEHTQTKYEPAPISEYLVNETFGSF